MNTRRGRLVRRSGLALLFLVCAAIAWLITLAVMAEPVGDRDWSAEANAILDRVLPKGSDATPLILEATVAKTATERRELASARERAIERDKPPHHRIGSSYALLTGEWADPRVDPYREYWQELFRAIGPLLLEASTRDAIRDPFGFSDERVMTAIQNQVGAYTLLRETPVVAIRDAAEGEEWGELMHWVESTLRLFRLQMDRPVLLDVVVCGGIWHSLLHEIRTLAIEEKLPAPVCMRLIDLIQKMDVRIRDIDAIAEMHALEEEHRINQYFSRQGLALLWSIERGSRHWSVEADLTLFDRISNVRALVAPRRSHILHGLQQSIDRTRELYGSGRAEKPDASVVETLRPLPGIWSRAFPFRTFETSLRHHTYHETARRATILMLRLAAHHDRNGHWPETLEAVATHEETIDPLTGRPFDYTLTPDDPSGAPLHLETDPPPRVGWIEWVFSHPRPELNLPYPDAEW